MIFKGKKVLVFGAGISGVGAASVLADEGAQVVLYDEKAFSLNEENKNMLGKKAITLKTGALTDREIKALDFLVLSPGVSIYNDIVQKARQENISVIGEVELAARICQGRIIAITGTNGKTTTTALLGAMIARLPVKSAIGGNIGQSLSLAAQTLEGPDDYLVAEISSFQLESVDTFRPHIAAILNITPDHLDRHRSFAEYKMRKEAIFARQDKRDYLLLNFDDPASQDVAHKAKAQTAFFSGKNELVQGAFLRDEILTICWQGAEIKLCPVAAMKIFGRHNVENALAASMCAFLAGVAAADIKSVLENFEGVEHRIEYVATVDGVAYYNDSKATNPESAIKALEAFAGGVVLIAGGYDKMSDLAEFMSVVKEKADCSIFLGAARERFVQEAQKAGVKNIIRAESFEEAVEKARLFAKKPQAVLLSPACSSYDMFNNFEERGRYFKQLVKDFS